MSETCRQVNNVTFILIKGCVDCVLLSIINYKIMFYLLIIIKIISCTIDFEL
jgi:hypothetical protein